MTMMIAYEAWYRTVPASVSCTSWRGAHVFEVCRHVEHLDARSRRQRNEFIKRRWR
jgi:hypothetical protein